MSTVMHEIELGKQYRDTISEFVGVATGRIEYLHRATEVYLEGKDDTGRPVGQWFPVEQLDTP